MKKDTGLKLALGGLLAIGSIILGSDIWDKAKDSYQASQERKRLEIEERRKEDEKWNSLRESISDKYSERAICGATLSNSNIKNKDDRSYAYDKLKDLRDRTIDNCYRGNSEKYNELFIELKDLYDILYDMDSDTIECKLQSMRNEDKARLERAELKRKQYEEELKHKRELEIIEENRKKDIELYEAKAEAERAKLKTICKAMEKSDKNIQSTLNIKTSISED